MTFEFPWVAYRGSSLVCQCRIPGVLNCMSGRLSVFPSLYWRYLCISYDNYNYWQEPKGQYEFKHTPESLGEVYAPSLVN